MKLLSSLALVALILTVALSAGAAAPIYAGFEPQPPVGAEDPARPCVRVFWPTKNRPKL